VQLKALSTAEVALAAGQAAIEQCKTLEGLSTMNVQKLVGLAGRIEAKITTDVVSKVLVARNTRTVEASGEQEDLGARGAQCVKEAQQATDRISIIKQAVAGYSAEDECSIEYAPSFLQRAYEEATLHGVELPHMLLGEAVRRAARTAFRDSGIDAGVAHADPDFDGECGVKVLGARGHAIEEVQVLIAADIVGEILEGANPKAGLREFLASFSSIRTGVVLSTWLGKLGDIINLDTDVEENDVAANITAITHDSLPEALHSAFASTVGKRILQDAKSECFQRKIDAGHSPPIVPGTSP